MNQRRQAGRAVVQFPYQRKGETYNSVILRLKKSNEKYGFPGGIFNPSKDRDTLDTAVRELESETGLKGDRATAKKIYSFPGDIFDQDIYLIDAQGQVDVRDRYLVNAEGIVQNKTHKDLLGIGFLFSVEAGNVIPDIVLEGHAQALLTCFGQEYEDIDEIDEVPEELWENRIRVSIGDFEKTHPQFFPANMSEKEKHRQITKFIKNHRKEHLRYEEMFNTKPELSLPTYYPEGKVNRVDIPSYYFSGNTDSNILDWTQQKKLLKGLNRRIS